MLQTSGFCSAAAVSGRVLGVLFIRKMQISGTRSETTGGVAVAVVWYVIFNLSTSGATLNTECFIHMHIVLELIVPAENRM